MYRWLRLRHMAVVLVVAMNLIIASVSQGAASELVADVEVFYPIPQGGRGGGVAKMGSAHMEQLRAVDKAPGAIRLEGKNGPVQGAWWFAQHRPLTPEQAMIGNPQARLVLEVWSLAAVETELQVQWRVEGETGEWVGSGPLKLVPAQATSVQLRVPAIKAGARITGLMLSFTKAGDYQIRRLSLGRLSKACVYPVAPAALREAAQVTISGRAEAGIAAVSLTFSPQAKGRKSLEKTADVREGSFFLPVSADDLEAGHAYLVTAAPAGRSEAASPPQRLFVYPQLAGKKCPPVTRRGADLIRDGKRFGFVGVNYTRFLLGLSMKADYEMIAADLVQMKSFGIRVARVSMDLGMIQPAPGVMPDDPRYRELMSQHRMDPGFVEQLDYFVALAGEMGIYTVIDWHGFADNPYRYFLGGVAQDAGTGKPGTAVAYLAPSSTKAGEFDLANPMHVEALLNAHRWVARHYRGNPNIMGIEIPFNEPHTRYMAVEANWRRITDLTAKAVAEGDPERLTFTLGPSYSHNNLLPSVTWLLPDRASGAAPHFYQANGPVPLRPDARKMREPWLAREPEGTFGWSFPAVMMPLSAVDYPMYNGETGAHGANMVLPDRSDVEASSILIEAGLVQEYATGMAGRMEWTMWGNPGGFEPHLQTYATLFNRFAPVYEAGPIDRRQAEVLFVQHPEASPSSNGHNFACIPFAKTVLDLHLPHVHYMTDDQLRHIGSAELAVGLEQVVAASEVLSYKAVIVDRRHLDPRVVKMLEKAKLPMLWLDDAATLTAASLGEFLGRCGVAIDAKSPRELQLIEGTQHLIIYRRLDGGVDPARVFPRLRRTGEFELLDEKGVSRFKGTAAQLAEQGFEVTLPLWRSAIYRIRPAHND